MVSVCMATYNGEEYLKEQLNSILSQLSPQDEIIICDDASTDGTTTLINSYKDDRIRLYINKKRIGVVNNFERSLSLATKEYIFLSDQDDVWLSNKIESSIMLLQKFSLVLSDCSVIDNRGKIVYDSFFKIVKAKKGTINNLISNSFIGCCMAFRREVLENALPFPRRLPMHDWWIGLIGSMKYRCVFYDKPLVLHRMHNSNSSTTGKRSAYSLQQKIVMRGIIIKALLKKQWNNQWI